MTVKICCINEGQPGQYFRLMSAEYDLILPYTPKWKTKNGAIRWAYKHGMVVVA